jgi:hypothetical protein
MKMKVVRCGGTTLRPVVEDRPIRAEIRDQPEEETDVPGDRLEAMVQVRHDEVTRENGHGVAKDQIFVPVEDPFLTFGQTIEAEKTSSFAYFSFTYGGQTTFDSARIVLEAD